MHRNVRALSAEHRHQSDLNDSFVAARDMCPRTPLLVAPSPLRNRSHRTGQSGAYAVAHLCMGCHLERRRRMLTQFNKSTPSSQSHLALFRGRTPLCNARPLGVTRAAPRLWSTGPARHCPRVATSLSRIRRADTGTLICPGPAKQTPVENVPESLRTSSPHRFPRQFHSIPSGSSYLQEYFEPC